MILWYYGIMNRLIRDWSKLVLPLDQWNYDNGTKLYFGKERINTKWMHTSHVIPYLWFDWDFVSIIIIRLWSFRQLDHRIQGHINNTSEHEYSIYS